MITFDLLSEGQESQVGETNKALCKSQKGSKQTDPSVSERWWE